MKMYNLKNEEKKSITFICLSGRVGIEGNEKANIAAREN